MSRVCRPRLWSLSLLCIAACTGRIDGERPPREAAPSAGASGGAGGRGGVAGATEPSADVGLAPLRRLTRYELGQTLAVVLGERSDVTDGLPADADVDATGYLAGGPISGVDATKLLEFAEAVAERAIAQGGALADRCAGGTRAAEDACARTTIAALARKLFRRPTNAAELDELVGAYARARDELALDVTGGLRLALTAMLTSPRLLYRFELGPAPAIGRDGVVRLSPHEVASKLAYTLTAGPPDDELAAAADGGRLADVAEVERHARRIVSGPAFANGLWHFVRQWLHIADLADVKKDATVYPRYTPALAASMADEVRRFVAYVADVGGGSAALFTSPVGFADEALASVYGLSGVRGTALQQLALPPTQRSGLLTRAAFLTATGNVGGSHPVKRGLAVVKSVLCIGIEPPPMVVPEVKPERPGVTTRQRYAEHADQPCARGCHNVIDPPGFAMEHYDGIGTYRETDNGQPVDASVTMKLDDTPRAFADAIELSAALAHSETVRNCLSRQWLRFASGHTHSDDETTTVAAGDAALAKTDSLRELAVAVATSRSFLTRLAAEGEVLQ